MFCDSLFKIIHQKSNYLIIKIGQISFLHDAEKLISVVVVLKLHLLSNPHPIIVLNASPSQQGPYIHCSAVSLIVLIVSLSPHEPFWKTPHMAQGL